MCIDYKFSICAMEMSIDHWLRAAIEPRGKRWRGDRLKVSQQHRTDAAIKKTHDEGKTVVAISKTTYIRRRWRRNRNDR